MCNQSKILTTLFTLIIIFTISCVQLGWSQGYFPWPDFTNVTPIVVDSTGDEAGDYDIISCRITFDNTYIYFDIKVLGTIHPESIYLWLDTDVNSVTGDKSGALGEHNIGADYYAHPSEEASNPVYLFRWSGSAWERIKALDYKRDQNNLYVGIARLDLNSPAKINILFEARTGTDYAPDTGFVTVTLSEPVEPTNWLASTALYIVVAGAIVGAIVLLFYWRRRGVLR